MRHSGGRSETGETALNTSDARSLGSHAVEGERSEVVEEEKK